MIICSCEVVSDKQIAEAVSNGAKTFREVAQATKCSTNCGCCGKSAKEVFDNAKRELADKNEVTLSNRLFGDSAGGIESQLSSDSLSLPQNTRLLQNTSGSDVGQARLKDIDLLNANAAEGKLPGLTLVETKSADVGDFFLRSQNKNILTLSTESADQLIGTALRIGNAAGKAGIILGLVLVCAKLVDLYQSQK